MIRSSAVVDRSRRRWSCLRASSRVVSACSRSATSRSDDANAVRAFGDRFDGDAVFFRAFQSEDISREIKASNLPTSLSEHFAGANGAFDDLVYVVGGIVFANDLAFAGIRSDDADTLTRRTEH